MGLTTCLGLHSQTTRLCESASWSGLGRRRRGSHPLGRPLPRDLGTASHRGHFCRLQFAARGGGDFQVGLFPVRSPLLGESWLVSSPPLIDMLKFSGCSCLNSGRMFCVFSCVGLQRVRSGQQRHAGRGRPTYQTVAHGEAALGPLFFSGLDLCMKIETARSALHPKRGVRRGCGPTLRQAYSRPGPRVQFAFKDSMIHIICNSHYVSHFAAFFIDTGAKISVVESCLRLVGGLRMGGPPLRFRLVGIWIFWGGFGPAGWWGKLSPPGPPDLAPPSDNGGWTPDDGGPGTGACLVRALLSPQRKQANQQSMGGQLVTGVGLNRCNDPSAGSPTETLLRLLLPLGGRV